MATLARNSEREAHEDDITVKVAIMTLLFRNTQALNMQTYNGSY